MQYLEKPKTVMEHRMEKAPPEGTSTFEGWFQYVHACSQGRLYNDAIIDNITEFDVF